MPATADTSQANPVTVTRRLLIISPHFPPVNAPDMQRVRMSLPHFVAAGWQVTVLAADDPTPLAPLEPELCDTIPDSVDVARVRPFSRQWTRLIGCNTLGPRFFLPMFVAGCRLLARRRYDLVYFSTTQFIVLLAGRIWRRIFSVPYVIDLQDPWRSDYYDLPGAPPPPGGWKYRFASSVARVGEESTIKGAAHVISVSRKYLETFEQRYRWWKPAKGSVIEFGAPDADFEIARRSLDAAGPLLAANGVPKIVYTGRLGPDMRPALEILIGALARCRDSGTRVEVHFFGTSYAAAGTGIPATADIAERFAVESYVYETTDRIGYLQSLRLLLRADIALLLGSDDKAYSPSKILPVLFSQRPVLAIAPKDSVLEERLAGVGGASLVTFESGRIDRAAEKLSAVLTELSAANSLQTSAIGGLERLRRDYSAATVARRQIEIFERVLEIEPGDGAVSGNSRTEKP